MTAPDTGCRRTGPLTWCIYALNVDAGTAREMAVAVLSEMRQGTP